MATGLRHDAAGLDENDPYRYGWRYVTETGPDGVPVSRQVPLTEADVLHPQEDDFIVQNYAHNKDVVYLQNSFESCLKDSPGRLVFFDHRIDFGVAGIEPFGPDLVVFDGVPPWDGQQPATFSAAEFGATPLLVVEVTSPSTRRNDIGIKVELYQRCAVPFYALIDRQAGEDGTGVALWGYRLGADGYEQVEVDEQGRLWLEAVGLWLSIDDGKAVCFDASGRRLLPAANLDRQVAELTTRLEKEVEARRQADERNAAVVEALNVSDEQRRAALRQTEAEMLARRQADERAEEAEKARRLADERSEAEAKARRLADERTEAEAKARRLADERAKKAEEDREAEIQARRLADERAKKLEAQLAAFLSAPPEQERRNQNP